MTRFLYQLDEDQYCLPWTLADFQRLRLWYIDWLNAVGDLGRFQVYLNGGSWASPRDSWDLDLFLTPGDDQFDSRNKIDVDDIETLRWVHGLIRTGYEIALNRYRFLIDFTYSNLHRLRDVFENYQKVERGEAGEITNPPDELTAFSIYNRYRKVRNGVEEFNYDKSNDGVIDLGEGRFLYQKPIAPLLSKQLDHILQGRVYHRLVSVEDIVSG